VYAFAISFHAQLNRLEMSEQTRQPSPALRVVAVSVGNERKPQAKLTGLSIASLSSDNGGLLTAQDVSEAEESNARG